MKRVAQDYIDLSYKAEEDGSRVGLLNAILFELRAIRLMLEES